MFSCHSNVGKNGLIILGHWHGERHTTHSVTHSFSEAVQSASGETCHQRGAGRGTASHSSLPPIKLGSARAAHFFPPFAQAPPDTRPHTYTISTLISHQYGYGLFSPAAPLTGFPTHPPFFFKVRWDPQLSTRCSQLNSSLRAQAQHFTLLTSRYTLVWLLT